MELTPAAARTLEQIYQEEDCAMVTPAAMPAAPAPAAAPEAASGAAQGRQDLTIPNWVRRQEAPTAANDPDICYIQITDPTWLWTTPYIEDLNMGGWSTYTTTYYDEAKTSHRPPSTRRSLSRWRPSCCSGGR